MTQDTRCRWWALLFVIGVAVTGACAPTATPLAVVDANPPELSFTPPVFLPATWLEAPLNNTVIADGTIAVEIIGNTGGQLDDPELLIEQDGTPLPSLKLDINAFSQKRPGLETIELKWVLPDVVGKVTNGEVIYMIRLRINTDHSMQSKPVRLRRIVPTPTSTSTLTGTVTETATPTSTPSATRTPTATFTWSPTTTSTITPSASATSTQTATPTLTVTPQPTPTSTPSLTPTSMECVVYVSGQGSQQQANVRKGPGTVYPIYGTLTAKDGRFKVTGKYVYKDDARWWQIQYTDKLKGFVSVDYVTAEGSCDAIPGVAAPPPPTKTPAPTPTPRPPSGGGSNPPPPPPGGGNPPPVSTNPPPACVPVGGSCTSDPQCCAGLYCSQVTHVCSIFG